MHHLRLAALLLSAAACAAPTADRTVDVPSDDVAAYVQARVAPSKLAFESPNGVVSEGTVAAIVPRLHDGTAVTAPLAACSVEDGDVTAVDMACATSGKTTGVLRVRSVGSRAASWVVMRLVDLCTRDGAIGEVCMNGEIVSEAEGAAVTVLQDVELTNDGHTVHSVIARRTTPGRDDRVAWYGSASYVIRSGGTSAERGRIALVGANGAFECDYDDRGRRGRCARPGAAFAW